MSQSRPGRATTILVLGVLLCVAGLGLWLRLRLFEPHQAADFGWFAYAPMSGETFTWPTMVPSAGWYWAIGLAALGAVLVSGVIGYRIGRGETPAA